MPTPANPSLYARVKAEAKRKFHVWPSAYGSSWLVKEYKRRGGKYKGDANRSNKRSNKRSGNRSGKSNKRSNKRSGNRSGKSNKGSNKRKSSNRSSRKLSGLKRWHAEKWINVCALPKIVPCGRSKAKRSNYPYCRPLKRINSGSPRTAKEISLIKLKARCRSKRKSPYKRQPSFSK